MKSVGVVRKIDPVGRLVLPKELRRTLKIHHNDELEIFVDGPNLMLKRYEIKCILCGSEKNVENYKDKNICVKCLNDLKSK